MFQLSIVKARLRSIYLEDISVHHIYFPYNVIDKWKYTMCGIFISLIKYFIAIENKTKNTYGIHIPDVKFQ